MLRFPGPWGWGLSFVLYDCTSHRSNASLLILHSSASLKLGPFCHFSGMALRILMSWKTTSSQETHCFAGLILIMLHFSNLISFCCRPALWELESFEARVQRSGCESPGFAPKPVVWPRAIPSAQRVFLSSSVKMVVTGSSGTSPGLELWTACYLWWAPGVATSLLWPPLLHQSVGSVEVGSFVRSLPTLILYGYLKTE